MGILMKKIRTAAGALLICAASFNVMVSAEDANAAPIVYEATVTSGTDVFGSGSKATFANATLDFNTGALQISNRLNYEPTGITAYALPNNGESFRFSYIVDPSDGRVSVAINGEIEASGICSDSIGITSLRDSWSGGSGVTVTDNGFLTQQEQSAQLIGCDTASVEIKLLNPISYSEILNIGIYTAEGKQIRTVDYLKNDKSITLKFAEELTQGQTYYVRAENITDIYGGTGSINTEFTPLHKGELVNGKDVAMSEEVARAWGFERRIDWHEESNFTKDNGWLIGQTVIGNDDSMAFYERIYKMPVTSEHHSQGKYSLKWDNHPYYSTVATDVTESDWTGANMFSLWIYSEEATGETVNILIYSDNPQTPWKDGYTYPIKVDWTGEKQFNIPLCDFKRFENPTGFDNVSAIYFTTKIFNGEPNPYTVLYLDDIRVTYSSEYPITPVPGAREEKENQHRAIAFNEERMNHNYPEVSKDVTTPFQYEAYFKTERALYGYYPKYNPGVASFDKDGKTYIRGDGTRIQYLENGKWQVIDLMPVVRNVIPNASGKIYDVGYEDPVIRFDNEGWAYVLVNVDAQTILCWSTDGMKTWSAKMFKDTLVQNSARFEHIDGGNTEAMERPPIILLHGPEWAEDQGGYLVIPSKTVEGGLEFRTVKYAESCISTAAHTGDGNFVVTNGDTAYVVYGIYKYSELTNPVEQIPSDHAANSMSYERDGNTLYYKNGVPVFVRTINMTDGTLSDPVFVGYGGVEDDNHNWPGISIDKEGYLYIIMNGHHDPFCFTWSKNKKDISSWNDISQVGTFNTYGAMLIDNDNAVHVITRDASRGYRFDTSIETGTKEKYWDWSSLSYKTRYNFEKSYVAQRVSPYYEVARQRMSYNPVDGAFYIHYYSQSDYFEVFGDEYQGGLFTWPNEERCMRITTINGGYNIIPEGTDRMTGRAQKCFWELEDAELGREGVLVKSTDGAKTFKLVQTTDCK